MIMDFSMRVPDRDAAAISAFVRVVHELIDG